MGEEAGFGPANSSAIFCNGESCEKFIHSIASALVCVMADREADLRQAWETIRPVGGDLYALPLVDS